jgi:hypothetical protein
MSADAATHVVTFARFDEDVQYTLGTYTQKVAEKIAVALARRPDVRLVSIRAVWEK